MIRQLNRRKVLYRWDLSQLGFQVNFQHYVIVCLSQNWHGTDPDGNLFLDYYKKLNEHGLFKNENDCSDFTKYYESFEWTERGPYQITEIFRFSNRPIQAN